MDISGVLKEIEKDIENNEKELLARDFRTQEKAQAVMMVLEKYRALITVIVNN